MQRSPRAPGRRLRRKRAFSLASVVIAALLAACASNEAPKPKPAFAGPDPVDAISSFIADRAVDTSDPTWKTHVPRPPVVGFPSDGQYYWVLHTNAGIIKIRLLQGFAPRHVAATMYLTELGFYDGLKFHRVIPGFMAQGGDPLGTGGGGPGFKYSGEFSKKAKHDERGIVSMANSGPRTDGSQFFILFKEAPHLDGKHTVFGRVEEGMGTLRSMEAVGSENGEPSREVRIEKAEILVE